MGVFVLVMKKNKTEIEELIRGILGKDKFLMLNITMIQKLTPNGACLLTYLLDKYEYLVKSKQIDEYEGMSIYRRELTQKLSLSPYQQRTIEADLKSKRLIDVVERRVQGETFNVYFLYVIEIYKYLEEVLDPLKKLNPPIKKLQADTITNTI
jgi:hypothetical protein